jgi:hypothetical protein
LHLAGSAPTGRTPCGIRASMAIRSIEPVLLSGTAALGGAWVLPWCRLRRSTQLEDPLHSQSNAELPCTFGARLFRRTNQLELFIAASSLGVIVSLAPLMRPRSRHACTTHGTPASESCRKFSTLLLNFVLGILLLCAEEHAAVEVGFLCSAITTPKRQRNSALGTSN